MVEEGIRASVGKNRKAGMVRRTIVQWMMLGQKQAIVEWQIKMKAEANREKVLLRSLRRCGKVPLLLRVLDWWFLFSIKRPLTRFYNNFRLEMKAEELRREALRAAHMKKVAAFAVEFVAAVDEDGDGGLSLNELKNNEVSGSNEMHKKAAIWLQYGRNFQRFDHRGIGIIDEAGIQQAMDEFLMSEWKYEGVLW